MSVLGPKRMLATAVVGALILLAVAWLLVKGGPRDGKTLPLASSSSAPNETGVDGGPPSTRALASSLAPKTRPQGTPRTPTADAPALRPETVVYGSLLAASGEPIRRARWANVSIVDRRGRRRHVDAKQEGAYAFYALPFGAYIVAASAEGYRSEEAKLDLRPEQPVLRRDFPLRESVVLKVKVVTPEGRSLIEARPEGIRGLNVLVPVATQEPPRERFFEVVGSLNNRFGVGNFWQYGPRVERLPPGYLGILVLSCDLPVHVSLVFYHVVLQSKRVDPGTEEVVFVLSPDTLEANLASIRLKVVEAESGEPIEGARVTLWGTSIDGGVTTDAGGAARIEGREPGRFDLQVQAEGREECRRKFVAEPGGETDLGTIPLEKEVVVQGRFLDAEGKGVSVLFALASLDPEGRVVDSDVRISHRSDGEGAFKVKGLGRRAHLLRTRNDGAVDDQDLDETTWVSGNVLVDTRGGPIPDLEVRLKRASLLVLRPGEAIPEGTRFRVLDEQGFPVLTSRFHGSWPRPLKLAPGAYRVSLIDAQGTEIAGRSLSLGPEGAELDLGP